MFLFSIVTSYGGYSLDLSSIDADGWSMLSAAISWASCRDAGVSFKLKWLSIAVISVCRIGVDCHPIGNMFYETMYGCCTGYWGMFCMNLP